MSTNLRDFNRTISPGDVVISVADIFDRLQGTVDENTLRQLLSDIISGRRNQVRPGELITAELINQILAELEALESRVTKLEAGGSTQPGGTPVDITDLLPHDTLRVGDELSVIGKNFLIPAQANHVTVGGANVVLFKSVSVDQADKRLVFDIPEVTSLSESGTSVLVRVENTNGVDTHPLVLRPRQTFPGGTLTLRYVTAPVVPLDRPNIERGVPYDFIFSLTARVNREANYTVARTITPANWTVEVLNVDNDQPLTQLTLPGNLSGETRQIRVRITPATLTTGPLTGRLELSVTENSGGNEVTPGNAELSIAINQPPPQPENRVTINFRAPTTGITVVANRLQFTRNTSGRGTFDLIATEGGSFRVTAEVRNPTGWRVDQPTSALPFERVFPAGGSTAPQDFLVALFPSTGAANTDLIFTVARFAGGEAFSAQFVQPISIV